MRDDFNGLRPGEAERLAMLIEECGEVAQAAAKVLRHGFERGHPDRAGSNRVDLGREITDLVGVVSLMRWCGDIKQGDVFEARARKLQYSHHQNFARPKEDDRGPAA